MPKGLYLGSTFTFLHVINGTFSNVKKGCGSTNTIFLRVHGVSRSNVFGRITPADGTGLQNVTKNS